MTQKTTPFSYNRRGILLIALLIAGLLAVAGRCWQLQYYKEDEFKQRAAHQQLRIILQSPRRGSIVDRKGKLLAVSIKKPSVWVDPFLIEDKNSVCKDLSRIVDLNYADLYASMEERAEKRYMRVKQWITEEQADEINRLNIRGVVVVQEYQRNYPQGKLAAHIIGYCDANGTQGLEGIEYLFNEKLAGKPGTLRMASDVYRRPIRAEGISEPGEDGQSIVLTIDSVIQQCVETQLEKTVKTFNSSSGSCIVMDPDNGEVLALANYPAFDLNQARETSLEIRRNQALTDPYEPGSTFKPFTVSAGIENKTVTINTTIDCLEGPYTGKGFGIIREYKNYFGTLTVGNIIVKSSNIGVAKIAQKIGADHFYKMIEMFGFGRQTGIDLPGEGTGLPSERKEADGTIISISKQLKELPGPGYTLTRIAYGQSIAVTPIQLLRGFCCLANSGILVKPRVVSGIIYEGKVVVNFGSFRLPGMDSVAVDSTNDAGRVISEKTARDVIDNGMVYVVKDKGGTGHRAHLEEWQVYGKTGTANIPIKGGRGYEPNKWIASFLAGAPADDSRICVLFIIREPDRSLGLGYTGGVVAAPPVKEIIRETLAYLGVKPKVSQTDETDKNEASYSTEPDGFD